MRPKILSFYCEVQDKLGNTLSSSYNREVSTEEPSPVLPAEGDPTFRRVVRALTGMQKGESTEIHLAAEEAYGLYDERLVMNIPMSSVDWHGPVLVGQEVMAETAHGDQQLFRVTRISGRDVVLDGNHPLAGQDLVVRVKITASRVDRKSGFPINSFSTLQPSGKMIH